MRIVFMGTPDFAAPCLQSILDAGHEVCGVYTQPDKPKGRGYALTMPPVKVLAQRYELPVFQPVSLRLPEVEQQLRQLAPQVIVVVAYGKILPKNILDIPPLGCVNVHGSLLPKYRGAAPIQWAVLNGEPVSGVTTMYMMEGIDTGDIILKEETPVGAQETSGELFDRLAPIGAALLVETLESVERGTAPRIPQREEEASYAPMLSKELSMVNWNKTAGEIHNLIRGLSPWPCASAQFRGKRMKLLAARPAAGFGGVPGEACSDGKAFLVACGGGTALELCRVQYEGGKPMNGADFLRGHPLQCGETLTISEKT